MKTTVIYHRADFDGIFCREIARKFLPGAELLGWDYGDAALEFPKEGTVYVLDLSPECLDASNCLDAYWRRLIWIDHHKSAIEKYAGIEQYQKMRIAGYRIDGVAACRLAWQWFTNVPPGVSREEYGLPHKGEFVNRRVNEPLAVRLAGEYDIWDKRDPRAELFQHGLRAQELTTEIWETILGNSTDHSITVDALLERGKALQYARTQENESVIKANGFTIEFEGLTFLACNHARFNSQLFTAGLRPEHDGCFGFRWDGEQWNVSLYHAPGKEAHDLSQIAVKYGGGGHRGACGFRAKVLPFLQG